MNISPIRYIFNTIGVMFTFGAKLMINEIPLELVRILVLIGSSFTPIDFI